MADATVVSYNGKKIEPAPFINFAKDYQVTGDGRKIGSLFRITVQGTLIAIKGSPDSDGVFYTGSNYWPDGRDEPTYLETMTDEERLAAIIRKQEAIRTLFSEDGHSFEVQSGDGSQPMKCNPRILNVSFPEGLWYDICPFTVTMEADVVYVNGTLQGEDDFGDKLSQASESWSIETAEDTDVENQHTYRLSHQISATGKRYYDETGTLVKDAWKHAQSYVTSKLGYDSGIVGASIVGDLSVVNPYNHVRGENIDEEAGTYSVTESWTLSNTPYTETFEVSTTLADGEKKVTINGTINGLETRSSISTITSTKIASAESRWGSVSGSLHDRAQTYSGLDLNTKPLSWNIARNIAAGVITYNYEYTNVTNVFSEAFTESIQISSSTNVDAFAEIFVLGRTDGPVLQDLGTKRGKTKTLAIEAVFPVTTVSYDNPLLTTYLSELNGIIDAVIPDADRVYVEDNGENWDARTGRASFNRTWKWD